ncbi:Hsp20/alpha crystallin family protein [Bacillus niameyensis]|uniref:Hsp20/alpha crystallin family protein n=1 Tax=Bacillus niameyensis TaxID=1522308 RepID=UPI000786461E|nr:Hsp20/alpha crystallin family protein [Bacillus niameyensis]
MEEKRPLNSNNRQLEDSFRHFMSTMDRLFAEPPNRGLLQSMDDFFTQSKPFGGFPVNLKEQDNEYIVQAELPGVKKEQIAIEVLPQYVSISVKQEESIRKEDHHNSIFHQKGLSRKMSRTIPLSKPVIHNRANAHYENGMLTIKIPKEKGRKINID